MRDGKRLLGVVTARGGSKGLPRKNLRTVGGVSLIARVGRVSAQLPQIDHCVLSTDDQEMARAGLDAGLEVPFMRPAPLAADNAGSLEVVQHALTASEAYYGCRFDVIVLMEPTCPLRTPADVMAVIDRLFEKPLDSAFGIVQIPFSHHASKSLTYRDGRLVFYEAAGIKVTHRQHLAPVYCRSGVAYAVKRECLLDKNSLYGDAMEGVLVDHRLVNIDDEQDLRDAEYVASLGG